MGEPFLDLADPGAFVAGVPHDYFAWLRANSPVHRQPEPGGRGFWAVTRHEDVQAVERDTETYSSWVGTSLLQDMPEPDLGFMRLQMLNMDAPQHTKLRALVNRGFTPRQIGRLQEHVVELTRSIIDGIARQGECDLVTEVAAELPLQVIAELIGIPVADRRKLFDWTNRLIGIDDPEFAASDDGLDARVAMVEMFAYAHELAEARRREPRDDNISTLVQAEVDGEALTDIEFNMFFLLLLVAGNETTRNAISGGVLTLSEHPDERRRVLDDPSLLSSAVEEILRWVSPVMQFRRTATRDTVLEGVEIAEGDKVVVYYPAANRDGDAFDDPDRFDVGRTPNPHLAFGIGPHFCLGASLARLEVRTMLGELLRRLPDLEPAGPVERLQSNFINGIKHLPAAFTPEG